MAIESLLVFALTEFVLCLTPGPAVLFVVGIAMRSGARSGIAAGVGVTAGTGFYFLLSALGIGALIVASATLFTIVKWLGAVYLFYLGARMAWPLIVALVRRRPLPTASEAPAPVPVSAPFWVAFSKGFAVQLANPKTLMFFIALFPQFIDPQGSVALQFALMAVVSAAMELPILIVYALLATASARTMRPVIVRWVEAAGGAILMGMAGALARAAER